MISRERCGTVDAWLGLGTRLFRPLELDGVIGAMTGSGGDVWSEMVNGQLSLMSFDALLYAHAWVETDVDILVSWGSHLRQPRYMQAANTIEGQEVKAVKNKSDSVATGFKYVLWEYPEDSMRNGCLGTLLLAVLVHCSGRCDTFTPRR